MSYVSTCKKCKHWYVPSRGPCPDCTSRNNQIIDLTPAMASKARALELGLKLVRNNIEGRSRYTPSPYIKNVATALGRSILRKGKI